MKNWYKVLLTLVILLAMAVNVDALEQKSMSRQSYEHADANWVETEGDTVTYTYLYVDKTNDETYISLSVQTYNGVTGCWSDKCGSTYTQENIFKVSKNLNSASLSEFEMEVYESYCNDMGEYISNMETLTVKADWVGKGEVSGSSSRYVSKYGDSISRSSDASYYRDATATGSINNRELGSSSYSWLSSSKSIYKSMVK